MFNSTPCFKYARPLAKRLDRRRFTRAMGVGLIAAPFVRLLASGRAHAAPGGAQRIMFIVTCGTNLDFWKMTGSSDQKLVTNTWNDGLDRVKDKIVVVENLDAGPLGHGSFNCLMPGERHWRDPSMDRIISNYLTSSGGTSPIPLLLLGSQVDGGMSHFRDNGSVDPILSPTSALGLVFAGGVPGAEVDEDALAAALARRKSMLDAVTKDLNDLYTLLGTEERPKLEAHLDSIRQFETRLATSVSTSAACTELSFEESTDGVVIAQRQMELARMTLACDISRVVGVQWGQHNAFAINLPSIDVVYDLHSLHHGPSKQDLLQRYESWFSHQFADFVESVAAIPDPETGGSLLDTTLIAWVRGMGDAVNHSSTDMRVVFAGGPGVVRTSPEGRYIDAGGAEYNRSLACMAVAMGQTDPSVVEGQLPLDGVLA